MTNLLAPHPILLGSEHQGDKILGLEVGLSGNGGKYMASVAEGNIFELESSALRIVSGVLSWVVE